MIDYDNSTFKEIWEYEFEEDLERRDMFSVSYSSLTGKFYDDINGIIFYLKSGKYHRESGPAYIRKIQLYFNSHCIWFNNGKEHRIDGPALYLFDEDKKKVDKRYFIFGNKISEEDFLTFSDLGNGNELVIL
ncbi:MAG: hypothetical protein ACOCV1_03130 [Bacillota bacterium]